VSEECGFKVSVASLEQALEAMADAMGKLYRNPEMRGRMGAAARERARARFHWARKAERMNALYEAVCETGRAVTK
jgi:glycosyltransferase involved in cell wall biosynthesis